MVCIRYLLDTYSIRTRYIIATYLLRIRNNTDLANTITYSKHIRYLFDTIHNTIHNKIQTYSFKMKNFRFQQQSECFGLIYRVNPTNTSIKTK